MNEMLQRKDVQIGAIIALIIILAVFVWMKKNRVESVATDTETKVELETADGRVVEDSVSSFDLGNQMYMIDGQSVSLFDGTGELKNTTGVLKIALLEGSAFADINSDGIKDAVVLLRSDSGTTIKYYLSVVLSGSTVLATNSIELGDRIRIKEISIDKGVVSVSILTRAPGEAMTILPTIPVTHTYQVVNGVLSLIQ